MAATWRSQWTREGIARSAQAVAVPGLVHLLAFFIGEHLLWSCSGLKVVLACQILCSTYGSTCQLLHSSTLPYWEAPLDTCVDEHTHNLAFSTGDQLLWSSSGKVMLACPILCSEAINNRQLLHSSTLPYGEAPLDTCLETSTRIGASKTVASAGVRRQPLRL